ncbi:glycine cleavage system aminomethyltransferase GcvT [Alsobacter sp. R-9]
MTETSEARSAVQTAASPPADPAPLRITPLNARHRQLGARMVGFAGYDMPVQYSTGILAEHQWTRENAGLFDVSHMGQGFLIGADHETVARALEALCPADVVGLKPGHQRYSQLLNDEGGILDDFMVTRSADPAEEGVLMLVVNAAGKEADWAHIGARLPAGVRLLTAENRALLALQGPKAAEVLARHVPGAADLAFMTAASSTFDGIDCHVSRSGYTGEDGYEISVKARRLEQVADALLAEPEVKPIGLGARDSLRLEAGLCLYGHDIDTTTSPVEAALVWSMQKRRREEGGFPGFERIRRELAEGPSRKRVGILPEGRAPAREGTVVTTRDGRAVGVVTSGGFGPTVGGPVAMGYVETALAAPGTELALVVRGNPLPARVVPLPFVPHRYARRAV